MTEKQGKKWNLKNELLGELVMVLGDTINVKKINKNK